MPDVTRSDSQRSDTSQRPRVSFNRDVHVKRIVPRESGRVVGALSGDGTGHLVTSPVRKERLKKSKKELAEEAAKVLHQADKLDCITEDKGVLPEKFYTLPNRKKHKEYITASLDRRTKRRGSLELVPPKKPPRTFATPIATSTPERKSVFDIFKKTERKPKKSNLRRSVSDATNLKSNNNSEPFRKRTGSDVDENSRLNRTKKQLSPIIEVTQREDYFVPFNNKENIDSNEESVTEQLKKYIDEVDAEIYKETGVRRPSPVKEVVKEPEVIIIDVDKAEKITKKGKVNKLTNSSIGKKLKSITNKKTKKNNVNKTTNTKQGAVQTSVIDRKNERNLNTRQRINEKPPPKTEQVVAAAPRIKAAIENLENNSKRSPTMIHSSQRPAEKLPLTKGRTVDTMVKRLSNDSCSPPPPTKTNILITPNVSMQHNNNQPFSYTRGLSPDKFSPTENVSPGVIYAQVVCGNNGNGPTKQTVHTTYTNGKKHPHSDSDEGLGCEENSGFSKTITHFGDEQYNGGKYQKNDYFDEEDKFNGDESPILPKFRNTYMNGYGSYEYNSKMENSAYIDSSSRGRGDGMDAKRRESLTENFDNNFTSTKINGNGRTDLSVRRDLLESRINRRLNDKSVRTSPDYTPNAPPTNIYVTESSSKYYRSGSTSPVGYKEKYVSETRTDKFGERYTTESRTKKYFGDPKESSEYENRVKSNGYGSFENEPKSLDSQISDYRSSPENRHVDASHNSKFNARYNNHKPKMFKDRGLYKSTPEIHQRAFQDGYQESYHNSLRREKHDNLGSATKYRSERFLDHSEHERKDKFGDSGIENDFRRDSADNYRLNQGQKTRREYCNESEDEGFASSLLITSERQHTDDNFQGRNKRRDYDSDRAFSREDEYHSMEYKNGKRHEYVPRERSIDDGSHYDPRLDKEMGSRSTLKKVERKPPKPEKKSSLQKMKQLFTRDSKKNKEKQMAREESLRARYVEYKGRDSFDSNIKKKEVNGVSSAYDYSNRRRLSTPSPSPTRNGKSESTTHGSWFKSLDRLSRKKTKKDDKESNFTSTEEETPSTKPTPTKNLRFFGDTDIESNDSVRHKSALKRPGIMNRERTRSQSSRDLHNISEELRTPDLSTRKSAHKSMTNISESERDLKGSRSSLKPPISPSHRSREGSRPRDDRTRRRKNEVSSVESSTEGDSSQQSQRSIVYLHAATVGDIPGPGYLRNGRRAASREELTSNTSSRLQPQVKTLSRSFSMLAPWKPRHYRETMDIDYTQYPKPTKSGKYEQRVTKSGSSRKENSSTLKKKAQETRRTNQSMSTLNRRSRSKENISSSTTLRRSREELAKNSNATLYKKKERLPRENSRYTKERDEKKMSSKSLSVESLGNGRPGRRSGDESRDISRSVSMPRDPEKSAGWFKMTKKSRMSGSTQRL